MPPVQLASGPHHEQAPVRQRQIVPFAGLDVLEREGSRRAERQGRDDRIGAQFRLVVRVVAHGIAAVPVSIQKNAVECRVRRCFDAMLERENVFGPTGAAVFDAGVAVDDSRVRVPPDQARKRHSATEFLLPGDAVAKMGEEKVRFVQRQKRVVVMEKRLREVHGSPHAGIVAGGPSPMRTFAVVPAAGSSVRMGRPKLLLSWRDKPIVAHVADAAKRGGADLVLAVVRAEDAELRLAAERAGADVLTLPAATPDMKATVLAGLRFLEERHRPKPDDGILLIPADHPTLDAALVRNVIAAASRRGTTSIVIPSREGKRGHPTWFAWAHVQALRELEPNEGLNAYFRRCGDAVREIPWTSDEIFRDLDTPEDYANLPT